jgi:hypothetical protein
MQWWWDSWIEEHDLWSCLAGAGSFAARIDLAGKEFTYLQEDGTGDVLGDGATLLGIRTADAVYGYVYNDNWSYWNSDPDPVGDVIVSLDLAAGTWMLSIYDALTGDLVSETTVVADGTLLVQLGTVAQDTAFILTRAD